MPSIALTLQRRRATTELQKRPGMDSPGATEVANENPNFGSPLLNDDFGQGPVETDDGLGGSVMNGEAEKRDKGEEEASAIDPLLQNPNGATQMFTAPDRVPGMGIADDTPHLAGVKKTAMRHMGGLSLNASQIEISDWGSGTDAGNSGKPQNGVPYGSFTGV